MKEILSHVKITEMLKENEIFNVNEKVDIWTIGCILFIILFKARPFQDMQTLYIFHKKLKDIRRKYFIL